MGVLKFGKPFKFNLLVKNDGNKSITVNKLSVGCTSCTKATMQNSHIGPTEEGVIDVEFTPGVVGRNRKSITVITDEGNLKMEFVADVQG